MKNKTIHNQLTNDTNYPVELFFMGDTYNSALTPKSSKFEPINEQLNELAEILVITSYPPRECGIATYSQDLIKALNNKFRSSFSIKICALESGNKEYIYPDEVKFVLNTSNAPEYHQLAQSINQDKSIQMVLIQHEFGFYHKQEEAFLQLIDGIEKPVVIVFHTVLPKPDERLRIKVQKIANACTSIIVMTNTSAVILKNDYAVPQQKITVIAHGTHLVEHLSESFLKKKYGLKGRKVLTTFGLLSSGKSIETTLEALPAIVKVNPEVVFLIIGKTHPEVVKNDGEEYRNMLKTRVVQYGLTRNVKFINNYLALPELLEYLQLTDIYLFTTNDPNQAVSGTFAYAMSCACPIISTPIPHAKEVLTKDTGIIFGFNNSEQLADAVNRLLGDDDLRKNMSTNALQKIVSTSWENSAVAHARLFKKIVGDKISLIYQLPVINLNHVRSMTTNFGMIQFSKINQPDIDSGYTLDDNARALIAICMHYESVATESDLIEMETFLNFIKYCQQPEGDFLNYVDKDQKFTEQNYETNLDDSNGRAIWALGYLISKKSILPAELILTAEIILQRALSQLETIYSTRAIAFAIKGLYYYLSETKSAKNKLLVKMLADRLLQMYKHESEEDWEWFESYLTYANSILPEAMLCAWIVTGDERYKTVARESFGFLSSFIFNENGIEVISNKSWLYKGKEADRFGEQPIDVAYTIMTLSKFYDVFKDQEYFNKLIIAFNWFLGNNRLHQIVYNPCTGGCYDGLEENNVSLNQGAESTLSYLMARLTIEKYTSLADQSKVIWQNHNRLRAKPRKSGYSTYPETKNTLHDNKSISKQHA
jgi:glycosyltransferase involved in cell wall biosynthesis